QVRVREHADFEAPVRNAGGGADFGGAVVGDFAGCDFADDFAVLVEVIGDFAEVGNDDVRAAAAHGFGDGACADGERVAAQAGDVVFPGRFADAFFEVVVIVEDVGVPANAGEGR